MSINRPVNEHPTHWFGRVAVWFGCIALAVLAATWLLTLERVVEKFDPSYAIHLASVGNLDWVTALSDAHNQ